MPLRTCGASSLRVAFSGTGLYLVDVKRCPPLHSLELSWRRKHRAQDGTAYTINRRTFALQWPRLRSTHGKVEACPRVCTHNGVPSDENSAGRRTGNNDAQSADVIGSNPID